MHRYRAAGVVMGCLRIFGVLRCHWSRQRLENAWCMYLGLRRLMREHTFDVLEMPECGAEGALISLMLAPITTPTVVRFHSPSQIIMPFYDVSSLDRVLCARLEQIAIDRATAFTCCSHFLADEARKVLSVTRPISVIANGIDLPLFDRESGTLPECASTGKVTILFAGRMERRKGIHLCAAIVKSVLRHRDVTFLFAGEDLFSYMENTLMPLLESEGMSGSVHTLGKLDAGQVRACLHAADILLMPSLWENCPYSCLEAMAAGLAIVASHQGGMPELIEHGVNGLLAEPGSPDAFAENLIKLIDAPDLRRMLGANARQTVELHFTDVHTAAQAVQVYEAAARGAHRSIML